jgi:hypothetical protein
MNHLELTRCRAPIIFVENKSPQINKVQSTDNIFKEGYLEILRKNNIEFNHEYVFVFFENIEK